MNMEKNIWIHMKKETAGKDTSEKRSKSNSQEYFERTTLWRKNVKNDKPEQYILKTKKKKKEQKR